MTHAKIICLEGSEGVGKTTQVKKLAEYLESKGFRVLVTKEPGTPLCPATVELRRFVLDNAYADVMTKTARELITQAIRSIHIEKVIVPALTQYDYIIQDRGTMSGLAYGTACGNDPIWMAEHLINHLLEDAGVIGATLKDATASDSLRSAMSIYHKIILLTTNKVSDKLKVAQGCKQEYATGDFIESRGDSFIEKVDKEFLGLAHLIDNCEMVVVDDKNIDEVFAEILRKI